MKKEKEEEKLKDRKYAEEASQMQDKRELQRINFLNSIKNFNSDSNAIHLRVDVSKQKDIEKTNLIQKGIRDINIRELRKERLNLK